MIMKLFYKPSLKDILLAMFGLWVSSQVAAHWSQSERILQGAKSNLAAKASGYTAKMLVVPAKKGDSS
jgi:hypothetical protein